MITVTRRTVTPDPNTGVPVEVVTTITGDAFEKSTGEPDAYQALKLTRAEAPLLVFTPASYADQVQVGDTLVWPVGGSTFTVRSARHLKPDGYGAVLSWLVVTK